jgi:hypothetical protein
MTIALSCLILLILKATEMAKPILESLRQEDSNTIGFGGIKNI